MKKKKNLVSVIEERKGVFIVRKEGTAIPRKWRREKRAQGDREKKRVY